MTKKRNPHRGSRLDDFLKEEGVLGEFQAAAIKRVIAWQIQQEMEKKRLSRTTMAAERAATDRRIRQRTIRLGKANSE